MAKGPSKYATFGHAPVKPPAPNAPHPHAEASWHSRILIGWATPLMTLGNEKQLSLEDTWPLQDAHQAAVVASKFSRDFERSRSLTRAFLGSFGWRFLFTGVAMLIGTATTLSGPVVLQHLVLEMSSGQYDVMNLATWILGLFALQILQALADNYASFDSEVIAIQFTAAMKNLIFRKSLRLSAQARKEKSTGDISNLITSDAEIIAASAYCVHQLWIVPLQIGVVSVMLYRLLGAASLAGYGVIFVVFLLNNFVSFGLFGLYNEFMKRKDERMAVVTEAFKSISIVKFNAWEDQFLQRIAAARETELGTVWRFLKFNASSAVLTWGGPVFISVAVFSVYVGVMEKELTPAIVFTSIALFQLVQSPLQFITAIIAACVMAKVGEGRINAFLSLPELEQDSVTTIHHADADKHVADNVIVSIENATFAWGASESPLLKDVNLRVKAGDFVVVHGPVGCGKSSLLSTLIGDMTKTEGQVYVGGNVAYCAQQPWIQHATVRDNILFGLPFDRKKYERVLDACALTQDLKSLPAADRTEIGERGINLSGGQKARVALARACYSDASVYILDAPLSAVDAIVQNEIFQKCLLGLLRHRTIILVTHNPEIIASEHVTRAVTINEDGAVVETRVIQGERPVTSPGSTVAPFTPRPYTRHSFDADEPHSETKIVGRNEMLAVLDLTERSVVSKSPLHQGAVKATYEDGDEAVSKDADLSHESDRLVEEEERKEGRVGFHVFKAYYYAVGGFPIVSIVFLSQVVWQVTLISSDFWVKDWSTDAGDEDGEGYSTDYRIKVYAGLGLLATLMVVVRTWMVSFFGLRASRRMFERMTHALMYAPMKFYDATPIGRVLMRYSNDVTDVDIGVPTSFGGFFASLFSVGCAMATTAFIIRFYGIFLLPVVAVYILVGQFYLQPAREIERIFRASEAPILSHLSETVEGSSTIRAFGRSQVDRFQRTNNVKLDEANRAWFARLAITRWFSFRIQLLGTVLVFVVASSLVALHNQLSAAIVGLAFTYVLKVSSSMERIVQSWSSVETTMVSPERLQQFTDVVQEAPHQLGTVPHQWPSTGSVKFDNVSFRYKEGSRLTLEQISFSVHGGEKIGIVGRTGAGKSSLTMALFRINELAGGVVSIDGVDVGKIGLHALRSKLSIIPQNPVLFKGTLRKNIDPFDEFSDDQIWDAIRRVGLSDRINTEELKLEVAVDENGENFSVGERQMLCMTRALLRDSRIVIFDEATAAIDHETDQKLQRVIREAFDSSTVLTIAHRLDTILDSDRILVLDGGRVVEFASPAELVKKGTGHFFDLMQEGGYLDKFTSINKQ